MKKVFLKKKSMEKLFAYALAIASFLIVQIVMQTAGVSAALKGQLVPICSYIVMAVSLNLTVGVLGELSLGHAGFMSVGAFSGVIACVALESILPIGALRLAVSMAIGGICAGIAGLLVGIPVLRLQGDYLAIVTLAFGEIIKNVINSLYVGLDADGLHMRLLGSASDLHLGQGGSIIVNGPMGIAGISKLSSLTAGFVLVMVTLFVIHNLVDSRAGRAILAVKGNRIAAESVGIPVTTYKLMAFVTSAVFAGAAGTLYAMNYSTIVASKFSFGTSILILVFVVLGGLGKMWGSMIAAAALTVLPELLREFNDYRMLVYAIVLITIMLVTNNHAIRSCFQRFKRAAVSRDANMREGG